MRLIHRLFILSLYLLAGCSSTEERQVSDHFDGKRFFNPTWDGEPFPKLSDVIRLMRAPKKSGRLNSKTRSRPSSTKSSMKMRWPSPLSTTNKKSRPLDSSFYLAERVGFEPTSPVKGCRFSRPVYSTTLPPLRDQIILVRDEQNQ